MAKQQSGNIRTAQRKSGAPTDTRAATGESSAHVPTGRAKENVTPVTPHTVGEKVTRIPVELSTRFLEHFSEQLYSSPQKAFEELISNGWDAGATVVDVRIDPNLQAQSATMTVFDNGTSMDVAGLKELWHIAFSPKEGSATEHGRPVIGKFGIGKLATYVLAEQLTYICRAEDGVIRRVTMDYGEVDTRKGAESNRLINNLELDVYELNSQDLAAALRAVYGGVEILKLIDQQTSVQRPRGSSEKITSAAIQEEFGGTPATLERPVNGTWTLVILSDLKSAGRDLKVGILRRILAAALPFGSEMAIDVNGERLKSTKINTPVVDEWVIGPNLDIDSIEISATEGGATNEAQPKRLAVTSGSSPYPYVKLPEVGRITGMVRLFEEKISGGKSDERGASNGFHVNVLGRVVNQHDPSFGEENLNHAAWARFRMTVRADGLNAYLTTNREQFKEHQGMKVFRAFLRKTFNKVRNAHDSDTRAGMPDGGDVLVRSLGVVSLNPLRSVVSEALRTQPSIPGMFDETGIHNRKEKRLSWQEKTAENIKNALGQIKYEKLDDDSFVKFRIEDSSVVVNREHPFVIEHSRSKAEKELIRTMAMIDLLADIYALDIGVAPGMLHSVRNYRDKLRRFRALQRRQSGVYIARLLRETEHDSANSKRLEAAVSDALRYLDFDVRDLGQPGEPEGIAQAFTTPTGTLPTTESPRAPLYSFSFDAKSSKHSAAKTGNLSLDAVSEHRDRYNADHALVVAPGFSEGAVTRRCQNLKITPMTTRDLGKLLEYTVEYGAIPVTTFRRVFQRFDPDGVAAWVEELAGEMKAHRRLTVDVFINALEELKGKVPDALAASMVAFTCRESLGVMEVRDADVISLAKGLQVIVPDLVGVVDDDKIVVNASAAHVAAAINSQMEKLHAEEDDNER